MKNEIRIAMKSRAKRLLQSSKSEENLNGYEMLAVRKGEKSQKRD